MGDLNDLADFGKWSRSHGAELVMVNPLCATTPSLPQEPSPYFPTSRCFRNPIYLAIEQVPGAERLGGRLATLRARGHSLNETSRIDRDSVFQLKMQALEEIWTEFAGDHAFDDFVAMGGSSLVRYATYCVLVEKYGGNWKAWPAAYHRANSEAVAEFASQNNSRVLFHTWLQWLLDTQIEAASREQGLMFDLPIGFHPDGADAWLWQDFLATEIAVGAPPDEYNTAGQNWGLPPFIPGKMRAAGYQPFVETIRANLRHAKALRIDHVMGLFRLFWIPRNGGAYEGTYVRYMADDFLAILALESQRAKAFVVGEDLGTVEPGVREKLADHHILSYRLMWFEKTAPEHYPRDILTAVTTHDLPTIAGIWTKQDIEAQRRIGLAPTEESMRELLEKLFWVAGATPQSSVADVIAATYARMARSPARIVLATVEDAMQVQDRPNMPGTVNQWPNWSIPLPRTLDDFRHDPLATAIARCLSNR